MEESGADDGERLRKRRKSGFMWAENEDAEVGAGRRQGRDSGES
jgi:hypothetical protein